MTSSAGIIAEVTALVTASTGWIGSYLEVITDNPLLAMFVIVPFIGLGVGLLKRLIRL